MNHPTSPTLSHFATEVHRGLATRPRSLSSKWFYDARGDELFQAIMAMPEYYLTDAEREIYRRIGPKLLDALGQKAFDLIELGAGDGSKTKYLIEHFIEAGATFTYRPIDISANAIEQLGRLVNVQWPKLPFEPLNDDYFAALDRLGNSERKIPRLVLFPGANIGNFTPEGAREFLVHLRSFLRPGDLLLTGFDLKKNPDIILAAYNDEAGHTAEFNLNLLRRINRELDADFKLPYWRHWETYDPVTGAARSYLVSRSDQKVKIGALGETFVFDAWEAIAVEISQKYNGKEIRELAGEAGYTLVKNYEDRRGWFTDSLWRVG